MINNWLKDFEKGVIFQHTLLISITMPEGLFCRVRNEFLIHISL